MSDTMQDEMTEATGEGVEISPRTGKPKRTHAKTTYVGREGFELAAVEDLPDNAPAGRRRLYFDILEAVANDNENLGKWHPIARFGTDMGANSVKNQLNKQVAGKVLTEEQAKVPAKNRPEGTRGFILPEVVREIPEYDGWHWEFDARKVASESGKIGARDSILYCRLVENA